MKEIRLGTIGSGTIVRTIAEQVAVTPGIRLCAVYSRSREKGMQLASDFRCDRVYTDPEAFFACSEINTVYIASPNSLHFAHAAAALKAGKHVICEKPICPTAGQLRQLIRLARDTGSMIAEAVPTAFLPNLEILREMLPEIGAVRLVLANYSQYSSRYDRFLLGETPNVFNPAFAGGALMDLNFYNVYLNVALFGKPRSLRYSPNLQRGIDTSGIITMEYDGFVSQCAAAKDARGESSFLIEGEKGYLRVPGGSNGLTEVEIVTESRREIRNLQPNPNRWFYEIRELVPMLLSGQTDALSARMDTSLAVCELLEQARFGAGIRFPCDNA